MSIVSFIDAKIAVISEKTKLINYNLILETKFKNKIRMGKLTMKRDKKTILTPLKQLRNQEITIKIVFNN